MITGLHWDPAGYAGLSGPLARKFADLDRLLLGWGIELGAEEHQFPTLINLAALKPLGYLRSFPQLATFAGTLSGDNGQLSDFAANFGEADDISPLAGVLSVQQLLTPAACYHFYHRLAGQELARDLILTTRCACHRRERFYRPLERHWCFHMRELVCIGSEQAVEEMLGQCLQRVDTLAADLGLNARWVTATDPFFDYRRDPKALAQLVEPVKRELVLEDGLAIASINRHRSFFGESYGIYRDGACARSACVAFGLERWLAAMARRFGDTADHWPPLPGAGS